jgi:hypothetical protein
MVKMREEHEGKQRQGNSVNGKRMVGTLIPVLPPGQKVDVRVVLGA